MTTAKPEIKPQTLFDEVIENARRRKLNNGEKTQEEIFDDILLDAIRSAYEKLPFNERLAINEAMVMMKEAIIKRRCDRARPMNTNIGEKGSLELIGKLGVLLFLGEDLYSDLRRNFINGKPYTPNPRIGS